jgi:hypothetical protein
MACSMCDGTMQNLGAPTGRIFWCARCGTLKMDGGPGTHETVESPIWVRQIVTAARFMPFRSNAAQHTMINVPYDVNQVGLGPIRLTQLKIERY